MVREVSGVSALASAFDDLLVDVWGVVHDGVRPFDGVVDALEALASAGKRVLFLTNTSRTSDAVVDTLVGRMGIRRELFFDVVSSGDVTRAALAARDPHVFASLSPMPRVFHHGDASYVPWLYELSLSMVDDVADAELVVASGAPGGRRALDDARALLAPAVARGVSMVCTNPDRVIPSAAGPGIGPGAVAKVFADLGGRVVAYGKPHAAMYREALRRLGGQRRVVAVGDMLETDVRGARAAGIAVAMVTETGAHAGETKTPEERAALFEREGIAPDMVLARFVP